MNSSISAATSDDMNASQISFEMTVDQKEEVRRIENAALLMPFTKMNHHFTQSSASYGGAFDTLNPLQIGVHFLTIVADGMIKDGIAVSDANASMEQFISQRKGNSASSQEDITAIALKAIGIIRNIKDREDNGKFIEVFSHPATGQAETYGFQLVSMSFKNDATPVYKLTQEGARLYYLILNVETDVDVLSYAVQAQLKKGNYSDVPKRIDQVKDVAIGILVSMNEIEIKIRTLSYGKAYSDELKDMLAQLDESINQYERVYNEVDVVFEQVSSGQNIGDEHWRLLSVIDEKIKAMETVVSQLKVKRDSIGQEFIQARQAALKDDRSSYFLPDIQADILIPMMLANTEALEQGEADRCIYNIMKCPKTPILFDPLLMIDGLRLKPVSSDLEKPREHAVELKNIDRGYSIADKMKARLFLIGFFQEHSEGRLISEAASAIMNTDFGDERFEQLIMHTLALFDPGDKWHLESRIPENDTYVDTPFFKMFDRHFKITPRQ